MEKTIYDIYAYVTGIKNKCRKTDRHQIKLGENLESLPEDLESMAKHKVIGAMRTYGRDFTVSVCKMTLKQEGDFQVKTYMPFSDTTQYKFSFNA